MLFRSGVWLLGMALALQCLCPLFMQARPMPAAARSHCHQDTPRPCCVAADHLQAVLPATLPAMLPSAGVRAVSIAWPLAAMEPRPTSLPRPPLLIPLLRI